MSETTSMNPPQIRCFSWASFGFTGISLLMYYAFQAAHQALNHSNDEISKRALERCLRLLSLEFVLAIVSVGMALWAFRRRERALPFWALLIAVGAVAWRFANMV